jgi:RNA polymerase-binding transcription factor DksA
MKGKNERKVADCKPFTLDDVRQLLEERAKRPEAPVDVVLPVEKPRGHRPTTPLKPVATQNPVVGPKEKKSASVLDILGFNPCEPPSARAARDRENVPQKWRKYYDQLVDMQDQLERRVSFLTKDTLEQGDVSDGGGGLNMLGQHTADGAAQQVDLELALTFVATEQDLLKEVNDALTRIADGTYGMCQQTGQAIEAKRLAVLPFARFSLQGQEEYERARQAQAKKQRQVIIFADSDEKTDLLAEEEVEEK